MNKLALLLSIVSLCLACDLSSKPESATDASIAGRFRYEGPPPLCDRGELIGQFHFLLYQNPIKLPLEGLDKPIAVRTLDADFIFDASTDCGLGTVDILRSDDYVLDRFGPNQTLLEETDFRLIVIFDHDANLEVGDPIRGQPNRDDVFGAAYVTVDSRRFQVLSFGPTASFPSQRLTDIDIDVDAVVHSELPAFRIAPGTQALSSEAILPDDSNATTWEDEIYALTNMRLEALPATMEPWRTILDREDIVLENTPPRGFWSRPVDPLRLLNARPHPIFGVKAPAFDPDGVDWRTPFVVMKRVRSTGEIQGKVPDVYLIPLTRPSQDNKQVFSPTIDLLMAPVAIVDLDPELPICQIPYLAPGNFADSFEDVPTECQEIPTGDYEITVQHGVAGGIVSSVSMEFSDIGRRVDDDEYIGQSWTIPNELGTLLADQGDGGRYSVIDPDPGSAPDPEAEGDDHGVELCSNAPDQTTPAETRPIIRQDVPLACCAAVSHLCDIELCSDDGGMRQATSSRRGRPNCMPFLIPKSCCDSQS